MGKRTLEQRGLSLVEEHAIVAAVVLVAGRNGDALKSSAKCSRHTSELAAVGASAEIYVGKAAYYHIFYTFGKYHFAQIAYVQCVTGKLIGGKVVEILVLRTEEFATVEYRLGEIELAEVVTIDVALDSERKDSFCLNL